MEITSSKLKERENQLSSSSSPLNSPTSTTTTSTNGGSTSIPITRSDPNSPYPTTFVTADTSSFKQVVQMLTGSPDTSKLKNPNSKQSDSNSKHYVIPPIKTPSNTTKKQGFKLYERRNSLKHMISPLHNHNNSHNNLYNNYINNNNNNNMQEILSPSLLDFPSLTLSSPVTPLSIGSSSSSEEDKAIAEKGFYLHPSPRESNPQLLPLFPLSSPRMSGP